MKKTTITTTLLGLLLCCGAPAVHAVMSVEDLLAELAAGPPGTKIAYGEDPLQFGELSLPEADGPFPVVVFAHGGCWFAKYDITTTRPLAQALKENGIAVWNLEYRRIGDPGGAYPGTLLDNGAGTDYLRELAKTYPLDLSRVVVMGHSAGGHLALWLGARHKIPAGHELHQATPIELAGVVALAPASQLTWMYGQGTCDKAAEQLIGGSPEQYPQRYKKAEPGLLAPMGVRQIVVLGAHDEIWTPIGNQYLQAARAAGDTQVKRVVVTGAGHFELINPYRTAWPIVLSAVREFTTGTAMAERIRGQQQTPDRHRFDLPRDEHRKPFEAFSFLGVQPGMTVMDVGAYAGYTSEMLAAAVGANGNVYSQHRETVLLNYAEGYYKRAMDERLANDRLPNVALHVREYEDLGLDGELDFAFLGNIVHDFYYRDGEATALTFLRNIKKALKPGGIFGLTDHVGVAGKDNKNLHRIEPALARDLLTRAGFVLEAESDLYANPKDAHTLMVYDEAIYRRTDRFLFRARKPAK